MCYCMCSDVMHASRHRQASHPYVYVACQKLLMDMPFIPAECYISKLTASHFGTLNTKIANQNMLKRILIAMHNKSKADCNENFRICVEEHVGPLYKWYASIGLWGWRYSNYKFSSGPFWTHKIKTKTKYINISNVLQLLSTPASIPCVEAVLTSLVVVSPSNCKFSFISDFSFDY